MYKKMILVEFDPAWLLAHRGDFDEYPVAYLAKAIAEELTDVTVDHTQTSVCCVLTTAEEMPKEAAEELFATFVTDKFGLTSLGGVAEIDVQDVAAPDDDEVDERFKSLFEDEEDEDEEAFRRAIRRRLERLNRLVQEDGEEEDEEDEEPSAKKGSKKEEPLPLPALLGKIEDIRAQLNDKIKGQTRAVEEFLANLFSMEANALKERRGPRALFLFAGPPGVGKTYLAETAASILGLPFLRLDMSAYSDHETSLVSFRGISPSYKAASQGIVTGFVREHPRCVLLFDEIEKAHANVIQLFLQILEGGRCRDFYLEEEISFTDTVIIMTTNAGRNLYEGTGKTNFARVSPAMVLNALETDIDPSTGRPFFPTAVLSRIAEGAVVMFNHLAPSALRSIVRATLADAAETMQKRFGIGIAYEKGVEDAEGNIIRSEEHTSELQSL